MALKFDFKQIPWYGQVGTFAALGVALVAAFWHFYAAAEQERLNAQEAELATVQAEIDRGLATAKRLPEFRAQITQLESQLDRLRVVLPEEQDVADLLRRVQGMATQSNLTIRGFEPQAVAQRELHAEWPIGLKLEGTYHDLGTFLERVSKFPRIIHVGALKIVAKEGAPGGVTVTAECTATTFVLMEPKPAAPGAKPAGAQAAARPAGSGVSL